LPAPTVAELGELLPPVDISQNLWTWYSKGINGGWMVDCSLFDTPGLPKEYYQDNTEAQVRASMLIYLLDKGLHSLPSTKAA
jgi:hypothetical protein